MLGCYAQSREKFVVAVLLFIGNLLAAPGLQKSLAKWPHGKRIHVVLRNGESLVGRLGLVQVDSFHLDPDNKTGKEHVLRIDDVRTVSAKITKAQKREIAAAVYGGLCVIGIVLGK